MYEGDINICAHCFINFTMFSIFALGISVMNEVRVMYKLITDELMIAWLYLLISCGLHPAVVPIIRR